MGNAALYRFMDKVRIQDGPIPGSPCWIWLGARSRGGGNKIWYGSFKHEGKAVRAHRWASEQIRKQECPKGFERHHICEDTLCVCPEHVEVITQRENGFLRWEDGDYEKTHHPPF